MTGDEFPAGGESPLRVVTTTNQWQRMVALLEVLTECCRTHPRQCRRTQLVLDVDNHSVVNEFTKMR